MKTENQVRTSKDLYRKKYRTSKNCAEQHSRSTRPYSSTQNLDFRSLDTLIGLFIIYYTSSFFNNV